MAKKKFTRDQLHAAAQRRAQAFANTSTQGAQGQNAEALGNAAFAQFMSSQGGPLPSGPDKQNLFQQGMAKLAPLFQAYDAFSGSGLARQAINSAWQGALQSQNATKATAAIQRGDVLGALGQGGLTWLQGAKGLGKELATASQNVTPIGVLEKGAAGLTSNDPLGSAGNNMLDSLKFAWNRYGKAPGMGQNLEQALKTPFINVPGSKETVSMADTNAAIHSAADAGSPLAKAAAVFNDATVFNPWAKRAYGLFGDVVTDPLTYASFGTEGAAKEVAGKLFDAGLTDAAARVGRGGVSAATSAELAKIGETGGMKMLGMQVLPHEVTSLPGRVTAPLRGAIGDKVLNEGVYKWFGKGADMVTDPRIEMRSGDATRFATAHTAEAAAKFQDAMVAREFGGLRKDFGQGFQDAKKAGWRDPVQVQTYIETADPAAKAQIAAGRSTESVQKIVDSFTRVADTIEQATGHRPTIAEYFPRLYVGPVGKGKEGIVRAFDTLAGRLKPGDSYLGHVIPQELDSAGVRQFIEGVAKDTFGRDYQRVFSNNPLEALDVYLSGVQKTVAKARRTSDIVGQLGVQDAARNTGRVAADTLGAPGALDAMQGNVVAALGNGVDAQNALIAQGREANAQARALMNDAVLGINKTPEKRAFLADMQQLQDVRARIASGDVTPEILQQRSVLEQRLASAQQSLGKAQSDASQALQAQIGKIKEQLKLAPPAEKRQALRAQLKDLQQSLAQVANTATVQERGAVTRAANELSKFGEMVRSTQFRQDVVRGWREQAAALEGKYGMEAGAAVPKTAGEWRQEAAGLFRQAADLADQAGTQVVEELKTAGMMESRAKALWATMLRDSEGKMVPLDQIKLTAEQSRELGQRMMGELQKTIQELGPKNLPDVAAELASGVEKKLTKTDEFFARHWDPILNWLKARQVATPGFALRNLQGGMFNNWLADVRLGAYKEFLSLHWGGDQALAKASELDRRIYREINTSLSLVESQAGTEIKQGVGGAASGSWRPWSSDFKPMRSMRVMNEHVESGMLRGTMMWDTFKKDNELARLVKSGDEQAIQKRLRFTHEQAMQRVAKYHFDYGDLSSIETKFVKRVIPFYTFSKNNLPLQLEMMLRKPTKFANFNRALQNLSADVPASDNVPNHFNDIGAVPTPFTSGGSRVFYAPDLPVNQALDFYSNPVDYGVGMVTPIVKTPIEYTLGKQFYKGIPLTGEMKPVPAWGNIPGLMPALSAAGLAKKGANGKWFMADKNQYVIEQAMPDLARARRMVPSDRQSQSNAITSWLSTVTGIRTRILTPEVQASEAKRRDYAVKDAAAQLKRDRKSGYKR